jgi:hypothetical protein
METALNSECQHVEIIAPAVIRTHKRRWTIR